MRKFAISLIIISLLILFSLSCGAETGTGETIIKTDLRPLIGSLTLEESIIAGLQAEKVTSKSISVTGEGMFGATPYYNVFTGRVGMRYYFSKAPEGLYLEPFAQIFRFNYDDNYETSTSATGFTGGGLAGYQFIISDVFVIDLNASLGYSYGQYTAEDNESNTGYSVNLSGFAPNYGVNLGFSF